MTETGIRYKGSLQKDMNRRVFLKAVAAGMFCAGFSLEAFAGIFNFPRTAAPTNHMALTDGHIRDYLYKMRNFDMPYKDDIFLEKPDFQLLTSALSRLKRLQATVGHGNFYLLNFDDALKFAKNYSRVGRFSSAELNFLEMIFYEDGSHYGFFGEKPLKKLTDRIKKKEVVKVPRTGNYLYKGKPVALYKKIRANIGDRVILTSGVRSVIKQFMLFLNKAHKNQGNLSLASRSLAPPGYSYHGVGDFDVGQIGLGAANFTKNFTKTRVFKKLVRLGYIDLRYQKDNYLGVRFEPWHIKVYSKT